MARFDRQIELAKRLILKNGQAVTWRQVQDGVAPADRPNEPAVAAPVNYPGISIVFLPNNRVNQQLLRALGATEVPTGNVYGLMGEVSFTPSIKDVVIRDGAEYRIKAIDTLSPNGQKILYTIDFDV